MNETSKRINPKIKREQDTTALMDTCKVFWAFSNSQFDEGKKKIGLLEGEKLIDIGAGGFMPAKYKDTYINGMEQIYLAFKEAMKDEKARKAHILYELGNHEAFYTRDISSTLDALGEDFTREEVMEVYKKNYSKNKSY